MGTTTVSRVIRASRAAIYRVCTDPALIARWRFPDNMDATLHSFDAATGCYRMSLTYRDGGAGKTSGNTDSFEGRFVELVPDRRITEEFAFDSAQEEFGGAFRVTTTLEDAQGGTRVTVLAQNLPRGVRPQDNETGTRMALAHLARLVE